MFSRDKLQKVLKDNQDGLTKRNKVNNYFKVVMTNQTQNVNNLNKEFKGRNEENLQKATAKMLYGSEDVEDVEVLPDERYISDNDNNSILARTLTLRNSKTPVQNIFMSQHNFNAIKPDKNYVAEKLPSSEEGNIQIKYCVEDTFHRAAGPILFLGQCFALMPVTGILHSNPKRVKFSYKSLQVVITVAFMCSSTIFTLTMIKFLLKIGINAKNFVGIVFFSCVQCSTVLFASLAQRWPKIIRYWSRVENTFIQKPYEMPKISMTRRVRLSAFCIIIGSAVEHAMYLFSAILSYKRGIELCATVRNYTEKVTFEDYVQRNYDFIFEILPYNMFVGISILEIPETVFIEIREHYVKLCEFLEFIDDNLSGIILLSCINNLYFVCYQLLNVFNKLRWPINYIYFWYSLLYLIGRTAFVFLSAASINDEAKGGLPVLRRVSSRTWCVEVERLIFEMTTQTVALSGKKFYFITRRLLFGMAGTIVTYELVLLQFDEPNRVKGLAALCA